MMVEALNGTGLPQAQELAVSLAQKWIQSNYKTFYVSKPHTMFEKVIPTEHIQNIKLLSFLIDSEK
jgi:hypothetical protein